MAQKFSLFDALLLLEHLNGFWFDLQNELLVVVHQLSQALRNILYFVSLLLSGEVELEWAQVRGELLSNGVLIGWEADTNVERVEAVLWLDDFSSWDWLHLTVSDEVCDSVVVLN